MDLGQGIHGDGLGFIVFQPEQHHVVDADDAGHLAEGEFALGPPGLDELSKDHGVVSISEHS